MSNIYPILLLYSKHHKCVKECVCLTSGLRANIWLYLPLAAPISSMLSGRVDKVSIDSVTKLSMACVCPKIKKKEGMHKARETEKERERESTGDISGPQERKTKEIEIGNYLARDWCM